MILDGFGIAGYRSFGEEIVFIPDLGKVNVFIGKNNSGKSNILRFCKHLSEIELNKPYKNFNDELDYNKDLTEKDIKFALQIKKDSPVTGQIYNRISKDFHKLALIAPDRQECRWLKCSPTKCKKNQVV
ncbi:MAG: AAA family ATPase [Candidatus Dadabacteria bacterium]|nr:AAA family ATPase [Candidatus Dadabacteria bacterium]